MNSSIVEKIEKDAIDMSNISFVKPTEAFKKLIETKKKLLINAVEKALEEDACIRNHENIEAEVVINKYPVFLVNAVRSKLNEIGYTTYTTNKRINDHQIDIILVIRSYL